MRGRPALTDPAPGRRVCGAAPLMERLRLSADRAECSAIPAARQSVAQQPGGRVLEGGQVGVVPVPVPVLLVGGGPLPPVDVTGGAPAVAMATAVENPSSRTRASSPPPTRRRRRAASPPESGGASSMAGSVIVAAAAPFPAPVPAPAPAP